MSESKQQRLLPPPPKPAPSSSFSFLSLLCSCCSRLGIGAPRITTWSDFASEHLHEELARVTARLGEAFAPTSGDHEKVLRDLWTAFFPDERLEAGEAADGFRSAQWARLGFQGERPGTDFRGAGMLGLDTLLSFVQQRPGQARRMLEDSDRAKDPGDGFSYAIVSLNATYVLACHLQLLGDHVDKSKVMVPGYGVLSEVEAQMAQEGERSDLVGFAGLVGNYGALRAFDEVGGGRGGAWRRGMEGRGTRWGERGMQHDMDRVSVVCERRE